MHKPYHVEICRQALQEQLSSRALEVVIAANLGQDNLRGQIGHPEYHFDDSQFRRGWEYVAVQRREILSALDREDAPRAWAAFGRLTHAVQDFYAHSNYVRLWLERRRPDPPPEEIDPLDPDLLHHPDLRSGRIYYPWEALSFIPPLEPLMKRLLPRDSHTHMNLDTPQASPLFPYAFHAALKRTRHEFEDLSTALYPARLKLFQDK